MVKYAKSVRLDAISITDHNHLFSWNEARRLSKEFGIVVIPGIEGGNIAVQKHWIALGVRKCLEDARILRVLDDIRVENGLSVAPHPHTRQGYDTYAELGFDAVESLNGTEPDANAQIRNTRGIPEVGGSDAHSFPMLGFTWTHVDADGSMESILEAVRHGLCRPGGSTIPLPEFLKFYPLYVKHLVPAIGSVRRIVQRNPRYPPCEMFGIFGGPVLIMAEPESKKNYQFQDPPARWIGIDLNTTGHAVVVADLFTGRVLKLGKKIRYAPTTTTKNCTKLFREGKLWKLNKIKTRERKTFKAVLNKISRQIVSFAESACAGIKFEKLFTYRRRHPREDEGSYEFSFENDSFLSLLHLVEKRALGRGIPVLYVDPSNTSKRCSRCGAFGRRLRKRFECPHCGFVIHADVNAALNIAARPTFSGKGELDRLRSSRKKMRRLIRDQMSCADTRGSPGLHAHQEILPHWDTTGKIVAGAG
jgi:putative transposase